MSLFYARLNRYSIAIDSAQQTSPDEWRLQSDVNKQGGGAALPQEIGKEVSDAERRLLADARNVYRQRVEVGIAREQARKDLPLSTYTEAYWKIDLHNLLNFLKLRMDAHAQHEIRAYAHVIGYEILNRWCPLSWQAFLDYQVNAIALTSREIEVIRAISGGDDSAATAAAGTFGWIKADGSIGRNRERSEAEQKLMDLGICVPWWKDH